MHIILNSALKNSIIIIIIIMIIIIIIIIIRIFVSFIITSTSTCIKYQVSSLYSRIVLVVSTIAVV